MTSLPYSAYIFDMDGTLWDAVDSYAEVWNRTIAALGLTGIPAVTRQQLEPLMGMPLTEIFSRLIGTVPDKKAFMEELNRKEAELMPILGGRLYPEVEQTLRCLKEHGARLFMVSNCGADGIPNFLRFTGLTELIEDWRSMGANGLDKEANIRQIIDAHTPGRALYIGDTAGDCVSSHAAGVDFGWASYGFGTNPGTQEITLSSIQDLLST